MQQALQTVSQAVAELKARVTVSWVLDRGFDDVAVWRTVWEQQERLVCRVQHPERLVEYRVGNDSGEAATSTRPKNASAWWVPPKRRWSSNGAAKTHAKEQVVTAEIAGLSGTPDL